MNDFPRWKYALVVFAVTAGLIYGLPNVFRPQPAVQISANRGSVVDEALKITVEGYLDAAKIVPDRIEVVKDRLLVRLPKSDDQGDVMNNVADIIKTGLAKDDRGDGYVIALNLASTVPSWLRAIGADSMPLGLDLQGGVHFLMQVDDKDVFEKQNQRYIEDIRGVLRTKDIRYQSVGRGPQGIIVQLRSSKDREAAAGVITVSAPELNVANGEVVGDAYTLVANLKPEEITKISQNTIKQNVSTLRNRINALGVSEPIIVQQGLNRIVVELAGVQDTADAKTKLGATATLEYRAVDESANPIEAERTGQVAPDSRLYKMRDGSPIVLKKKVIATGDELVDASSAPDPQTGSPAVSVVLNESGGRKMLDFTTQNVGKRMGVVYIERTPEVKIVDGKEVRSTKITEEVINDASINGVFGKRFQTTGIGSAKEASDLALFLRSGSLAAPVDIVSERVIGPSQGQDNIQKGVFATVLALVLVIVFVAFYYKVFGLIADVALILNLVLLIAILSLFQATLTLPGIAGIVLTLGMAIDANVLICERIREELRNGSTPLAAIRGGYEKAWATIFDANLTHLIAALGLMTFGSGPLRGFAITLTIGILTSMFTSVTITRALISLVYSGRRLKHVSV